MKPINTTLINAMLASSLLCGGIAPALEIESVDVENGQMKLKIKTPPVEIEKMNPDGSFTKETESTPAQNTLDITVPADAPTKLVRAKVTVGNDTLATPVDTFVPKHQLLIPRRERPANITVQGEQLTITLPVKYGEQGVKFPQGFPVFLEEGPVMMMPNPINERTYTGAMTGNAGQNFRTQLAVYMNRLRTTGNGKVSVYMGRQHTGNITIADPAGLPAQLQIFPFVDAGLFEPVTVPGAPVLGSASAVNPKKSLLITDLTVVEDPTRTYDAFTGAGTPMGKWTIGYLLEQMCNQPLTGITPDTFALFWLNSLVVPQVINSDPVPGSPAIATVLINKWRNKNISMGLPPFDLTNMPFRLTAIVNRLDLRDGTAYSAGNAGECRFVFCAFDLDTGNHLPLTVIFEYGVPLSGCADIKMYAMRWQSLTSMPFGPPTGPLNRELEKLTDISTAMNADPTKPNNSALNQLRTNNFIATPWTLREWQILTSGVAPNMLNGVTTKQTPQDVKQGTTDLATFVNAFTPDILAGSHTVPLLFPGATPFLSGKSTTPSPFFFWDAPGILNNDARHCFSLATCNGCHGGEAVGTLLPPSSGSIGFVHIAERDPGIESTLSNFLLGTNMPMPDPVVAGTLRSFDDLTRRAADLDFVANAPCLMIALTPSSAVSVSH